MPIEKTVGYKVGQEFFTTLIEAQIAELSAMLPHHVTGADPVLVRKDLVEFIAKHAPEVVEVLSPGKELRSRKPRSDKGTKKGPRKPSVKPTTAPDAMA